mmetsp:Transcript_25609/g.71407  ORF Transcript_25609/g.71407 Transcript_25609/m.71407 type:complete len:239 (-) Transcript_25609:662-1378(-)
MPTLRDDTWRELLTLGRGTDLVLYLVDEEGSRCTSLPWLLTLPWQGPLGPWLRSPKGLLLLLLLPQLPWHWLLLLWLWLLLLWLALLLLMRLLLLLRHLVLLVWLWLHVPWARRKGDQRAPLHARASASIAARKPPWRQKLLGLAVAREQLLILPVLFLLLHLRLDHIAGRRIAHNSLVGGVNEIGVIHGVAVARVLLPRSGFAGILALSRKSLTGFNGLNDLNGLNGLGDVVPKLIL